MKQLGILMKNYIVQNLKTKVKDEWPVTISESLLSD